MKRVTGLGGVFLKCTDPQKMYDWYERHLGIERLEHGESAVFQWRDPQQPEEVGMTVWALFPRDSTYFKNSSSPVMLNYRVADLDALLEALAREGVSIDPHRENYDYGRFAWITDPEGNRIELWEPPKTPKRE
ncbi:MAG TPA: VOC family protein [Terriglobales bacterium]|nr:VOC family protein [Terriglobales bacterium]